MKQLILCVLLVCGAGALQSQTVWTGYADSTANLSSPRAADLNNDGVLDIVFGAGRDGFSNPNGVVAIDGATGATLWTYTTRDEVFGSAIFMDITADGIPDVFIVGREAQFLALNGADGSLIWDFWPHGTDPTVSGYYNFYNPQFIHDVDSDGTPDILVSNGGDHAAPVWQTTRPPGHLMVLSGQTGQELVMIVVPDSAEIYCSPVVADLKNDGNPWVLFGTGGETLPGHFYAALLSDVLAGTLANAVILANHATKGFVAPASICETPTGEKLIYIQGYAGDIIAIRGSDFTRVWDFVIPGTESSSSITIGNFTGDLTPDVFAVLYKGSISAFTDFYQVMIDGRTGNVMFKDSIGTIHFASANAFDYNNDGRDEAFITVSTMDAGYFRNRNYLIDFQNDQITQIGTEVPGVNLASTPLIADLDNDGLMDLVFLTKRDSINPSNYRGVYVTRENLSQPIPNSGIAWGSYMGTQADGHYLLGAVDCGPGSVFAGGSIVNPSCNGLENGSATPTVNVTNGPHTYVWSDGTVGSSLQNAGAGNYWVRVTDALGCYQDHTFTLNDPYQITFGGQMAPTCPRGTNGSAIMSSTGCPCMFHTCIITWDNGQLGTTNSLAHEGWNVMTVVHPDGCTVTDSTFVPFAQPVVTDTLTTHVACFGDATGAIEIEGNAMYVPHDYLWSGGEQTAMIDNLSAGLYQVTVQDGRGCSASIEVEVTENDPLVITSDAFDVLCHGDASGYIEITITGGQGPYFAYLDGQPTSLPAGNLSVGGYDIWVVDDAGCQSNTATHVISQPTPLQISIDVTHEMIAFSNSGMCLANVSGGTPPYTYLWDDPNDQNTDLAVYLNTGLYTVIVTDANGCVLSESAFVDHSTVTENVKIQPLNFYPNPANDWIEFNELVQNIRIFSAEGKLIQEGASTKRIQVGHLASGSYVMQVINGEQLHHLPLMIVR